MKEDGLTLKKARSRRYLTETITNSDYDDDIMLSKNTTGQAEYLLQAEYLQLAEYLLHCRIYTALPNIHCIA